MAAVAREFPPPPTSRRLPPRPVPKSAPPPLPPSTEVDAEEVLDFSDTAAHEFVPEDVPPAAWKRVATIAASAAIEHDAKAAHPGVVLLRTIGFFVVQLTGDGVRSVRAYFKAHWVRASARARR